MTEVNLVRGSGKPVLVGVIWLHFNLISGPCHHGMPSSPMGVSQYTSSILLMVSAELLLSVASAPPWLAPLPPTSLPALHHLLRPLTGSTWFILHFRGPKVLPFRYLAWLFQSLRLHTCCSATRMPRALVVGVCGLLCPHMCDTLSSSIFTAPAGTRPPRTAWPTNSAIAPTSCSTSKN